MRKTILAIFVLSLALAGLKPASAVGTMTVTNNSAPAIDIYRSEFDQLVMDVTISRSDLLADTLRAITFQNTGSANINSISKVVVWADVGQTGFQGMDIDEKLGEATWTDTYNGWYLSGLNKFVPSQGLRTFVSIETPTTISANALVQMEIPALVDNGATGQFQIGDQGIFMDGVQGPAINIVNPSISTIRVYNADIVGPKTVITNPANGIVITANTYTIKGTARDQAGSTPALLQISFNSGPWSDVTAIGSNFSTWEYNWVIPADGTYIIKTQGTDWTGNKETVGSGITVTVNTGAANSVASTTTSLIAPENILPADGLTKTVITATVKNASNNPLAGKIVGLVSNRGDQDDIKTISATTDVNGHASFEVKSKIVGSAIFSLTVDGTVIDKTITIQFTTVAIAAGDLIKASTAAVYYYGADGKRYVFPNEKTYKTWYADFSTVKTITDAELAAITIGGNVTYKPGVKMVKITTDPKVYAVAANGTLRWVQSEDIARAIYGNNWSQLVEDISDAFFTNYKIGDPIVATTEFFPSVIKFAATNINVDKGLGN
jgi:hypothetical protein